MLIIGSGRKPRGGSAYSKDMTPQDLVFVGEESFRKVKIAEHQKEFQTLPAVMSADGGAVTMRYKLSEEELDALNHGSDVFLTVITMGKPLQPIMAYVNNAEYPTTAKEICEDWRQFVG